MKIEEAIETIRRGGSLEAVEGKIRYEIRGRRTPEIDAALSALKANKPEALAILSGAPGEESLAAVLKGQAVELWSDSGGRLFLVADEADAHHAMERFGTRRSEVYTALEARRIIAVGDPAVVAEIHEWKKKFDGVVR